VPAPEDPDILDYAPPPPPLKRRDSREYYREPPISENIWGVGQIVIFILCLIAAIVGILKLIGYLIWPSP
jgi:hypothetical protein